MGAHHEELSESTRITYIFVSIALILGAGIFSGLTLGLFSIDMMYLRVNASMGHTVEKARAKKILPLLKRHHLTLVALLVSNAGAMTALPIFLERLLDPTTSLILSVTAVLIFGEVIPQASFVKKPIPLCAFFAPLVWVLIGVTFIVSWPFAKLLDKLVGHKSDLMEKNELGEFFAVQQAGAEVSGIQGLSVAEVNVMRGAMLLSKRKVRDIMKVKQRDVFMLSGSTPLNKDTIERILGYGFSRIPICMEGEATHILGVLLVKSLLPLAFTNPDPPPKCGEYHLREVLRVSEDCVLEDLYESFQTGQSHMAVVYSNGGIMRGIVTLEDVLQVLHSCTFRDEFELRQQAPKDIEAREKQLLSVFNNVKKKKRETMAPSSSVPSKMDSMSKGYGSTSNAHQPVSPDGRHE